MKMKYCLVASAAVLVASCSSTDNTVVTSRAGVVTKPQAAKPAQYLALPGQAAVAVGHADVDSAFDAQVAQYGGQPQNAAAMGAAMGQAAAAAAGAINYPLQQNPMPTPMMPAVDASQPTYIHQTAVPGQAAIGVDPGVAMVPGVPGAAVPMNYAVRITNCTPGRIFVEAQDAAGSI